MNSSAILPENERVLRKRFPCVFRRIQSFGNLLPTDFRYEEKNGIPELITIKGDRSFSTYGNENKNDLLQRWMAGLELAKESLYAISGFGDGSHAKFFLNHSSKGTHFIVAEKDPSLLRETLCRFDCSELLSDERFMLGVGEPDEDFFRDIQSAAVTAIQEVNMVVFSPLHSVDETYYDKMRNELVRQYLVVRPMMEVNIRTAPTIQSNTFENIKHMAVSPDISEVGNEMSEIPFILVGAGPSLDESVEFLQRVQDKAIIVCSNSPLRKLLNNGIRPHLVVTADPQSPTFAGFKGIDVSGLTLACPFSAYPEIVKLFEGRILSWCTFNPIVDLVKKFMGKSPGTPIMEKGTVSGCVLDISRLLGSKKVLFVGQDMCIRDDGRYYTDDSAYSDHGGHYANTQQGHRLPGNTSDKVIVEGRLFVYLKTFEQFISSQKNVDYRNLARTGVRVKGAPYISTEEAENWIGNQSSQIFERKVESLLLSQATSPNLPDLFRGCRNHIRKLFEKSLIAAIETEKLPEKFSDLNYSGNPAVKKLLIAGKEINDLINKEKDFWMVLFEGKTKGEVIQYRRKIREMDSPNPNWGAVQRNKEYFWAISEGSQWLLNELEKKIFKPQKG